MGISQSFREDVYDLMRHLPDDKVTTYGDIAAHCGHPYAARVVGGVAHTGDESLPWHRLVNRAGGLAAGFPGGRDVQQQLLVQDGISCTDFIVDNFKERRWNIPAKQIYR